MPTHKCIYCMRKLDADEFKTEHVIPQAFGKFEANLTLNESVCGECNQYFGDKLELIFARDSFEAYDRVRHGLKLPAELHDLLHERLTFALADEGKWTGFRLMLRDDAGTVVVGPVPQVRFCSSQGNEQIFVTELELENPDESLLKKIDLNGEIAIFSPSESVEGNLIEALTRMGVEFKKEGNAPFPKIDETDIEVEVQTKIDQIVKRCVAKIAFNYLTYTSGAAFVHGDNFNVVRSFIREGQVPDYLLVRVTDDPILSDDQRHYRQTDGHLVTVNWTPEKQHVIAQVSLFNRITYHVSLARGFSGFWREIRSGHLFDIGSRSISGLVGTSLIVPRLYI